MTADQYPYVASSTSLAATLVPTRFRDGTENDYKARLADPERGPQIRKAVEAAMEGRDGGKSILIARYKPNRAWQGKSLHAIAEAEKKSPVDVVLAIEAAGGASVVNFGMSEEDVRLYMKQPWVATASDGSSQIPARRSRTRGVTAPSPKDRPVSRRRCVARTGDPELGGLPADILRLNDRGYLARAVRRCGRVRPESLSRRGTFEKPPSMRPASSTCS